MSRGSSALYIALAAASACLLAGCSGASNEGPRIADSDFDCANPSAQAKTTSVAIQALPLVSNGAIHVAKEQGFFDDYGLDVDIQPAGGLDKALAAVQGGAAEFAFSTTTSVVQAVEKSVPISIVAPLGGLAPGEYEELMADPEATGITALVASEGIADLAGLDGKTVALADVRGQSELTTRWVLKEAGVDAEDVEFTVMALPDGLNAFKAGKVDAIYTAEPFLGQALAAGGHVISWPSEETFQHGVASVVVASNSYVSENTDTVLRMNCALRRAAEYSNSNPDEVRAATAKAVGVPVASLATAVPPYFAQAAERADIERTVDIMVDLGFIQKKVDVEKFAIPQIFED
ncbi:ABC transporter substrate-binding protein [Nocardioides carbamazepini]|uniref:ABC transporter substrate-binding protein n=1 Tax=Nocardioides carbamazepini TaxID=2854259 RepID=UPI002149A1BB|nr:ABC transporter substrate-binding protein [Nocardioides carbamazepini]MCR1784971.1 ABC transporter substrate-binding protein [Nocardioides carbamazepini]